MLTALLGLIISATPQSASVESGHDLPAHFVANRVFVEPTTSSGKTLRFYTDSGGGANLLCRSAADRLGLNTTPTHDPESEQELGKHLAIAHMPRFEPGHGIPANLDGDDHLLVYDCNRGQLIDGEGFLSSRWFAGRVWTWDYPHQQLRVEGAQWQPADGMTRIPLGFQTDTHGKRKRDFARITIHVDGKPLDMLLDTGATAVLNQETMKRLADELPARRATSFIVKTQFDEWHKAHPKWLVIENAQPMGHAAMIEVPTVEIGASRVSPVWFTERSDDNFHTFMSAMTDKQIEGAIGGNALRHFVMTVDYPNAAAYFRCTKDCGSRPQSAP